MGRLIDENGKTLNWKRVFNTSNKYWYTIQNVFHFVKESGYEYFVFNDELYIIENNVYRKINNK